MLMPRIRYFRHDIAMLPCRRHAADAADTRRLLIHAMPHDMSLYAAAAIFAIFSPCLIIFAARCA